MQTLGGIRRLDCTRTGECTASTVEMGIPRSRSGDPDAGPAWETFLSQPFDVGAA
jgi:hypothetical protein